MYEYLNTEVLGITDVRQLLLIVHLIGLALGAGAAFFSDFLFTNILKDKKIDKVEFRILNLASSVVWLGTVVLFLSGLAIFLGDTDRLMDSDKFLAKMTIVSILVVNGVLFHFYHIPRLRKLIGKDLSKNKQFKENQATSFFISGAVSGVSWAAALVLGALNFLDMSYALIMTIYGVVVLLAAGAAVKLRDKILS